MKTITLTIALLLTVLFASFIQGDESEIEKINRFYLEEDSLGLLTLLDDYHTNSLELGNALLLNDTLKMISQLLSKEVEKFEKIDSPKYFFLQQSIPRIRIGEQQIFMKQPFYCDFLDANKKEIIYDSKLAGAIRHFIGANPYGTDELVKQYLKDKGSLSKRKLKKAIDIIQDYNDKVDFIGKHLALPATWGKIDLALIRYQIKSLTFDKDMTFVWVNIDAVWTGRSVKYRNINEKWIEEEVGVEWIH
ncbi:hypothetical protein N8482_01285 [Chitinophagales bacterium]|nr:hypothetical protein [Chitinophagales bacterium]